MLEFELNNFQSHKNTSLKFDAGVNVIVGVSDSGKSAIMRALRWLWTSRPLGDYFVRWGEKDCTVKLCINGNEIIRGKEKKNNYYSVNGKTLEATKTEVPAEVVDALKLEDINWQGQRDLDFLLSLSPLETSKYIQKLCGLEAVPPVLSNLASIELETKKKLKDIEEQKINLEKKIKSFEDFGKVQILQEHLEKSFAEMETSKAKIDALEKAVNEVKDAAKKLQRGRKIPDMAQMAIHIKEMLLPVRQMNSDRIKPLEILCMEFGKLESRLADFKGLTRIFPLVIALKKLQAERQALPPLHSLELIVDGGKSLAGLDKKRFMLPDINLVADHVRAAKEFKADREKHEKVIVDAISMVSWTREDLRKTTAALNEARSNLPKVCPACGRAWETSV
jgi:DNA repair exonuclease SbcCD ATPase subunit